LKESRDDIQTSSGGVGDRLQASTKHSQRVRTNASAVEKGHRRWNPIVGENRKRGEQGEKAIVRKLCGEERNES